MLAKYQIFPAPQDFHLINIQLETPWNPHGL
jgi:hypothetical protein